MMGLDLSKAKVIGIGAEALIYSTNWRNRRVVVKHRVPKGYRHKEIDDRLRQGRTKGEARLIALARDAGVRTPMIYDIDVKACTIVMEFIEGETLVRVLEGSKLQARKTLLRSVGHAVARLHRADLIHGDLTGANMLVSEGLVQFIDFGLGVQSTEVEDKGVDLHVLQEALKAVNMEDLFKEVEKGYLTEWSGGKEVVARIKEIATRGRYN
jgi:TP53 regulating kinase and related kinases